MNRHVLYNCESTKGLSVKAFAAGASVVILCERGMMVDCVSRHLAQRFVRLREQPLIRLITFLESNDSAELSWQTDRSQLVPPPRKSPSVVCLTP